VPSDGGDPVGQQQSQQSERSGEDARRRGWFWHWNTIITQYAPLVGLKGVGLLNSYTVWTDRREESPHHGYAFPSQQSEADFYGEDRAELITINKILVALGLIEIRKEMVLRVDERGRRWKVPHNLYRVRDHQDGYNLSVEDVLRVVELATTDRAVYRYIRRIFSSRFAPIDADNVWHRILPVLREHDAWRELEERATRDEARASARTKAGHANRTKSSNRPSNIDSDNGSRQEGDGGDSPVSSVDQPEDGVDATSVGDTNDGLAIDVEPANNGSATADDESNKGFRLEDVTIAGQRNEGGTTGVGQSNTTYYEGLNTTTTTTTVGFNEGNRPNGNGAGPLPSASPAVVSCFEAANDRGASPLEIELLAELEATYDGCAQRTGQTGSEWVVAAIREAVGSGSRFVAPKRVKEILNRWSNQADSVRPGATAPDEGVADVPSMNAAGFRLPDGRSARAVWERTLKLLAGVLEPAEMERLFDRSAIVAYQAGTLTVETTSDEAAERLGGEYYELVSRKLAEAMRRSVRIEFIAGRAGETPDVPEDQPATGTSGGKLISFAEASRPAPVPSFVVRGGLTNHQIWSSVLETLSMRLTAATLETWVRPASIIGMEDDTLILGTPNAFAQRRLSTRLQSEIVSALGELLDGPVEVRVVVAQEWLRQSRANRDAGETNGQS
jgi:hypothetical protein